MHSKEGVTQGEPLVMIAYVIGAPLLIRELREAHPYITQSWYADDTEAVGKFPHILAHLQDLQARGLRRGYFPEPTKSVLVVAPPNVAREEEFFSKMGLKVVMSSKYLGGFIGEGEAEKIWMTGKVAGWAESVETLAGVSRKHPQSAYDGLQKSLQ